VSAAATAEDGAMTMMRGNNAYTEIVAIAAKKDILQDQFILSDTWLSCHWAQV
jgi:hypothetical protein